PQAPKLDLDDPGSITGLATIGHANYTQPGGATPAPDQPGVFRIDAWILIFDSEDEARTGETALENTLIEPFGIIGGGTSQTGNAEATIAHWDEGYIDHRSLPPGNGIVYMLREQDTVYAAVVYAIDDDPRPVAEDIIHAMTADSTVPPDDRLPQSGVPALHGLVLSATPAPPATPAT